jgi:hypothetical protein
MLRFRVNRYWTLILALCLASASFLRVNSVRADSSDPGSTETSDPNIPGGSSSGDPDMPDGPGKTAFKIRNGAQRQSGISNTGMHSVGDGVSSGSALMWKIRVVMLGLRKFYLRF